MEIKKEGSKYKEKEEAINKIRKILLGLKITNGRKQKLDNLMRELRIVLEA